LCAVARRIEEERSRVSSVLALEAGKPLKYARAEVDRAIQTFTLGAEEARRFGGEVMPLDVTAASEAFEGSYRRFPVGPVLGISPFNFPLNLVAHKVAPALAVGASVVIKPAPQTPLSALLLAEFVADACARANAPADALQVVPAGIEASEKLVRDPRFGVLSFTGSDKVGFHLKSICGKKRTLLELGGNAAALVHEDARDLGFAAKQLAASAFGYAGQVCIRTQRIFVHAPVAEAFTRAFLDAVRALGTAKDERDDTSVMGPLIDEKNAMRVDSWVEEAKARGADVLLRGARSGNYLAPSVVRVNDASGDGRAAAAGAAVAASAATAATAAGAAGAASGSDGAGMRLVEEEVFGPAATIHVYSTWDDAIRRVNASRYGLQAAVFTDSFARVRQAYEELAVGGVVVGDATSVRVDVMPYGGVKDSGQGREGVRFAMQEMSEPKMLVVRKG
jgi:glyceraldehyde-3-phosphate dehydrogenase (NADP+)